MPKFPKFSDVQEPIFIIIYSMKTLTFHVPVLLDSDDKKEAQILATKLHEQGKQF